MKKLVYAFALCALMACQPKDTPTPEPEKNPVGSFARGGDIGWLTEEEHDGIVFYNDQKEPTECLQLLQSIGMNAVRLRVWVNHKTGWCNQPDVLIKARRAHQLGLRIMIDFHYSDYFCDPGKQNIPAAWADFDETQMAQALADHTTQVLTALQAEGITPEWIQVGNETTNGMLWPMGKLWGTNGWKVYVRLSNAGYEACKQVFPDATVIVHVDNAYKDRTSWYKDFKQAGGRFDMIGLSHYPQTNSKMSWEEMNTACATYTQKLSSTFGCKVMIAEVGTKSSNRTLAAQVMQDFKDKVCALDACAGAFYWEPQVNTSWRPAEYKTDGWNAYDMGAFTSSWQPAEALKILFAE